MEIKANEMLKNLRKRRGFTQDEMAVVCKVNLRTYQTYESGESLPRIDVISILSEFFDVSTDYIIFGYEEPVMSETERKKVELADQLIKLIEDGLVIMKGEKQ